ncbi:MAG: hypothetical protein ACK58T_10530, partial [Phycisphaerae bacterium]
HSSSTNKGSSAVRLHQPTVASSDERPMAGSDEGRNTSFFGNPQTSVCKAECRQFSSTTCSTVRVRMFTDPPMDSEEPRMDHDMPCAIKHIICR